MADRVRNGSIAQELARAWLTQSSPRLFGRKLEFGPAPKGERRFDLESSDHAIKVEVKSLRDKSQRFGAASEGELLCALEAEPDTYFLCVVFVKECQAGECEPFLLDVDQFLALYSGANVNIKISPRYDDLRRAAKGAPVQRGKTTASARLVRMVDTLEKIIARLDERAARKVPRVTGSG